MWISFLMYNYIAIESPIAWFFFHRNIPYNQPWITVFSRIFMTKYVPLYLDFCITFCYYIQRNCHSYFIVNEMHQIFFDRIFMYEIPQNAYFDNVYGWNILFVFRLFIIIKHYGMWRKFLLFWIWIVPAHTWTCNWCNRSGLSILDFSWRGWSKGEWRIVADVHFRIRCFRVFRLY